MKPAQEAFTPRAPMGAQNPFLRTIHLDQNEGGGGADFAGYGSLDDLVKGYRSSSSEAQRLKARAEAAEQRAALLEQQYRPPVPQRGDPAARLSEYGVPVDALDEYVNSRISAGVAAAFEPVMKGASARNQMLSQYADYNKYESEVATFVNGDPVLSQSYQKMFSVDPVAAMEFAFLKFGETKRKTAGASAPSSGNGAAGPQAQARAEAQIPSTRAGDARTMPGAQGDEQLQRGWEHYQKTGDPRAYAKMRLRQVISDDFLNG